MKKIFKIFFFSMLISFKISAFEAKMNEDSDVGVSSKEVIKNEAGASEAYSEKIKKQVEGLQKNLKEMKTILKSAAMLMDQKKIWEEELKNFKVKFPKKGPKQEDILLSYYYSFQPLFDIAEKKALGDSSNLSSLCEQKKNQILIEDVNHTVKDKKTSFEAQKAVEILETFCSQK